MCCDASMHAHPCDAPYKAMTYNIFVSRPLKCHLPMRAGGYYLLRYYILFCTKPAYLTAGAWPFSMISMITTLDAVPKNACRWEMGNYYNTSHGLNGYKCIALGVQGWLFSSQQVCKTLQPHQCSWASYATA